MTYEPNFSYYYNSKQYMAGEPRKPTLRYLYKKYLFINHGHL